MGVKQCLRLGAEPQCDVASVPEVIAEIIADHFALVAEAEDEILVAVVGVGLHDVPEDGAIADGEHRLGAELGFLLQARAAPTAKDDDFHGGSEYAMGILSGKEFPRIGPGLKRGAGLAMVAVWTRTLQASRGSCCSNSG